MKCNDIQLFIRWRTKHTSKYGPWQTHHASHPTSFSSCAKHITNLSRNDCQFGSISSFLCVFFKPTQDTHTHAYMRYVRYASCHKLLMAPHKLNVFMRRLRLQDARNVRSYIYIYRQNVNIILYATKRRLLSPHKLCICDTHTHIHKFTCFYAERSVYVL